MPALNSTFDITATQGKTFVLQSVYENDDGTPVDLTGYTGRMQVRQSPTAETVVVELTEANSRFVITDAVNGAIQFYISAADMAGLAPGVYVYDSELVNGAVVEMYLSGSFTIEAETTR